MRSWQETYVGQVPQDYLDTLSIESREQAWVARYDSGDNLVLVLEDEHTIVGFAHLGRSRDRDAGAEVGEVTAIYLRRAHWGRGGGRVLMAAALTELGERGFREATLWVLTTNGGAQGFYEATGWTRDGAEQVITIGGAPIAEIRYRRPLREPT
jgi:GNAT superfamily N-acetyltransferase